MIRDSGHGVPALEDMIPNFIGLRGLSGGKRLLRPAGIARISPIKLGITGCSPAIDKQCALDSGSRWRT